MARHGITYANVAKVAAEMADEGKSVTVDSVREALGSTGSKSTIAPLVKRWKAEHEDHGVAVASGLPAHLLEAVTALNQRMQADADLRIHALTETHEKAVSEMADRLSQSDGRTTALTQERDKLVGQLAEMHARNEKLTQQDQERQIKAVKADADIDGLNRRLADRGSEIEALQEQLAMARQQFEHYQQSVAEQRADERKQNAQQVARVEQELADTRRSLAAAQTHATQVETRLEQSTKLQQQQHVELTALRKVHQDLLGEHKGLMHQISTLTERKTVLESQFESAVTAQVAMQTELAVTKHAHADLTGRLTTFEKRAAETDAENRRLLQANALLQGQLEAHATRPKH
jgi:chromosome segregation ATPase